LLRCCFLPISMLFSREPLPMKDVHLSFAGYIISVSSMLVTFFAPTWRTLFFQLLPKK